MKELFREYHQFTPSGYKTLLKDALFVFDTNTLLNMYRYSRPTVTNYVNVLKKLKKSNQIWIPYHVGYEFYENRISVINEYKNSYDNILTIIGKTKSDIKVKYKDHPFLDMDKLQQDIARSLENVEKTVNEAKANHPDWTKNDDVLKEINALFESCVGIQYSETTLTKIYEEGKDRYINKIPPGFKDNDKPEPKKYGDLIVWYQIIDKAREIKKPIVFVSGDIKEDWWLINNGERLMPLPRLKREMLDKANVDFHIYTADKFLELHKSESGDINKSTIDEVRKVLELEELRMAHHRDLRRLKRETFGDEDDHFDILDQLTSLVKQLDHLNYTLRGLSISSRFIDPIVYSLDKISFTCRDMLDSSPTKPRLSKLIQHLSESEKLLRFMIDLADLEAESKVRTRTHADRLKRIRSRLVRYMDMEI